LKRKNTTTLNISREVKKIMQDIRDMIQQELDKLIMNEIVYDLMTGVLLLEAEDEVLEMMLNDIWSLRPSYERAGVVIGDA